MLKSLYDTDHANLRFQQTVIRFNNDPVLVVEVRRDWSASAIDIINTREIIIPDIRDEALIDHHPTLLGFFQNGEEVLYLQRSPVRRTKQGLDSSNLFAGGQSCRFIFTSNSNLRTLGRTILGNYATFKRAFDQVYSGKAYQIAFHRNWAVQNAGREDNKAYLLYKYLGVVGLIGADQTPEFNNGFQYLAEVFEEEVSNELSQSRK